MWKATIKGLLAHKLRLALTALAIVLGVMFVTGTLVLTDTLHNTFTTLFDNIYQKVDFVVREKAEFNVSSGTAARKPIPESVATTVRAVPGVEYAEGTVSGYAQFVARDGKAIATGGAPTLGVSMDPQPQLSSLTVVSGARPTAAGQVDMDQSTAQKYHFAVGDRVRVLLSGPPRTFTIAGIVRFGTAGNLAGATIAGFDIPTAQQLFGSVGSYDAIDVLARPGTDTAQLRQAIAGVLPPGAEVVTGETVANESSNAINQALSFFSTALLVFAFIALFVGGFTIFNTFSIIVGQRTKELALLRILGASRRQVFRSVLAEAFIVGLVASIVGLGLGVATAVGLVALLKGFGISLPTGALVFQARTVIAGLAVGIGVTVVSAISPARRAVRIAPVEALVDQQGGEGESLRRRVTIGGAVLGVGAVVLAVGLTKPAIQLVGIGAVALFIGVGMLSPLVARPMAGFIGVPLANALGVVGKAGARELHAQPAATAQTAAALMVGLALVSVIAVFGASVSKSATASIDEAISADYIVTASSAGGAGLQPVGGERGVGRAGRAGRVVGLHRHLRVQGVDRHPGGGGARAPGPDDHPAHVVGRGGLRPGGGGPARGHHHGPLGPSRGGFGGAGEVRPHRWGDDAGRWDLHAQLASGQLPRERRVLPIPLLGPAPRGRAGAGLGRCQRLGQGGAGGVVAQQPQRQGADPGRVQEVPGEAGEPAARAGLRAARPGGAGGAHRHRQHPHAVGVRAHPRDRPVARRGHAPSPGQVHDPLRGGDHGGVRRPHRRGGGYGARGVLRLVVEPAGDRPHRRALPSLVLFLVISALLGLGAASWPARRAARLDLLAAIAAE